MGSLASQSALLAEDGVQVAASQQLKARPLQMFHDKGNKVFSSVFPIPQTVRSAATLTSNILDKKWCLVLTTTRQNPCHHLRLCDNFRKSVLTQRWTRVCAWQCVRQSSWGMDHLRTAWHTWHCAAGSRIWWRTPTPLALASRPRSARGHRPETLPPLEGARTRPRPGHTP
jgi:hypothetical protein